MNSWDKGEIVLVINQDSRRALSRAKTLQTLAKKYRLKTVTCSGQDLDYAVRQELQNKSLKRLVIAGGDGSLALAAGLLARSKTVVELAVIPVGTSNYYSKTLGLRSLAHAFEQAVNGQVEARHVCEANNRVFIITASIGVTSRMFELVTDHTKKRLGKLAYAVGLLRLFFLFNPMKVTITANGETNTYATTELQVINQSVVERLYVQPRVDSRQPFFEIVTYGVKNTKISPIYAFIVMILTFGRNQKYLKRIQATEATISIDRPEIVSLDGESIEHSPLSVSLLDKPLYFVSASASRKA